MTLIVETICNRIVYYRNKCNLTQIELAANVAIRFPQLVNIEAGLKIPRMIELEKLANGLDISITELVTRR